jgi:hypothetical protein
METLKRGRNDGRATKQCKFGFRHGFLSWLKGRHG